MRRVGLMYVPACNVESTTATLLFEMFVLEYGISWFLGWMTERFKYSCHALRRLLCSGSSHLRRRRSEESAENHEAHWTALVPGGASIGGLV